MQSDGSRWRALPNCVCLSLSTGVDVVVSTMMREVFVGVVRLPLLIASTKRSLAIPNRDSWCNNTDTRAQDATRERESDYVMCNTYSCTVSAKLQSTWMFSKNGNDRKCIQTTDTLYALFVRNSNAAEERNREIAYVCIHFCDIPFAEFPYIMNTLRDTSRLAFGTSRRMATLASHPLSPPTVINHCISISKRWRWRARFYLARRRKAAINHTAERRTTESPRSIEGWGMNPRRENQWRFHSYVRAHVSTRDRMAGVSNGLEREREREREGTLATPFTRAFGVRVKKIAAIITARERNYDSPTRTHTYSFPYIHARRCTCDVTSTDMWLGYVRDRLASPFG